MADEPTTQQSISDDQELAKVLAGVDQETTEAESEAVVPQVMPSGVPTITPPSEEPVAATPSPVLPDSIYAATPAPVAEPAQTVVAPPSPVSSDLDTIKQAALGELRPLVDKLDVNPEEKFDTYLLLLRSTDDKNLIEPAHDAAKNIADEARRAQALLDIIKEIDFLSQNQ